MQSTKINRKNLDKVRDIDDVATTKLSGFDPMEEVLNEWTPVFRPKNNIFLKPAPAAAAAGASRASRDAEKASRALLKMGKNSLTTSHKTLKVSRKVAEKMELNKRELLENPGKDKIVHASRNDAFPIVEQVYPAPLPEVQAYSTHTFRDAAALVGAVASDEVDMASDNDAIEDVSGFEFEQEARVDSELPLEKLAMKALSEARRDRGVSRKVEKTLKRRAAYWERLEKNKNHKKKNSRDLFVMREMIETSLSVQLDKAVSGITKKTDRPLLTGSAEILMNNPRIWTVAHEKEIEKLVDNAKIWRQNMNWKGYTQRHAPQIFEHFPPRCVLPTAVGSVSDENSLEFLVDRVADPRKKTELRSLYKKWCNLPFGTPRLEIDALRVHFYDLTKGAKLPVVVSQGQTASAPVPVRRGDIKVKVTNVGIPVTVNIFDSLASFFPDEAQLLTLLGGPSEVARKLVSIICVITSLYECSSWPNILAQLTQLYLNVAPVSPSWFLNRCSEIFSKLKASQTVSQAGEASPFDSTYGSMMFAVPYAEAVRKSSVVSLLWDFLSTFSVVSVFSVTGVAGDDDTVFRWKRKLEGLLCDKMSIDTLFKRFLKFASALVYGIKEAFQTGDWRALFSSKSPADWVEVSYCVLDLVAVQADKGRSGVGVLFEKMKAEGNIPARITAPLTVEERCDLMRELCEESKSHISSLVAAQATQMAITVSRLTERLKAEIFSLENNKANGQGRKQPFGIYFYGDPGVGKSRMTPILHQALGNSRKLPIGPESVFTLVADANFYDAFNNQWLLTMDDADQTVCTPTAGNKTHVNHVVDLINTKSTQLEQADVDAKGKKYANFLAALYLTNYEFANLQHRTTMPLIFWRRFKVYVKVEVMHPFASPQGSLKPMDQLTKAMKEDAEKQAKLLEAGKVTKIINRKNNYWRFKVYKYDDAAFDKRNPFTSKPYVLDKVFHDRSEFLHYLTTAFNLHIDNELEEATRMADEPFCPRCFLGLSQHDQGVPCVVKENQGFREVLSSVKARAKTVVSGTSHWVSDKSRRASDWATEKLSTWVRNNYGVELAREWIVAKKQLLNDGFNVLSLSEFKARMKVLEKIRDAQAAVLSHKVEILTGVLVAVGLGLGFLIGKYTSGEGEEALKKKFVASQAYVSTEPSRADFDFANKEVKFHREVISRETLLPWPDTIGPQEIVKECQMSTRKVWYRGCSPPRSTHMAYYTGFCWVFNAHFFISNMEKGDCRLEDPVQPVFELELDEGTKGATPIKFTADFGGIQPTARRLMGRDLVLVYVPTLVPLGQGLRQFIPETSISRVAHSFDAGWVATMDFQKTITMQYGTALQSNLRNACVEYTGCRMYAGDCGVPVIGRSGKWLFVVGIHSCQERTLQFGVEMVTDKAEEITRVELDSVFRLLVSHLPYTVRSVVVQSSQANYDTTDIRLKDVPAKSSLSTAVTYAEAPPMQVLGTMDPPQPLAKMKSNVFRTPMADVYKDLEEQMGGSPLFYAPIFKGKMVPVEGGEPKWVDPFTIALKNMRNVQGRWDVWMWALDDYCEGMENLAGWDQIRVLTDFEAWVGVDGTSVKSTNMKTSAGTPFFTPKKRLVSIDKEKGTVEVNVAIKYFIDQIEGTIAEGDIYSPLCRHSLKDEPISKKKLDAGKVRVFNTLSMAFNFCLKKYIGPLTAFMRVHPFFFESAVGMNITSRELDAAIRWMKRLGEDGFADGDYEAYDLRPETLLRLITAIFWYRMAVLANYDEKSKRMVFFLSLGLTYSTRCIKNDLFVIAFGNPSGSGVTSDENSPGNSFTHRYSFRRAQEEGLIPPSTFREAVALLTLGDDNMRNVHKSYRAWDSDVIAKYMSEVGQVFTSAQKDQNLAEYGPVEKISFLKRKFQEWKTPQGTFWAAPLELKSIVKMVTCAVRSELSEKDHCAVLLSNSSREAFLHGREVFEDFRVRAEKAATLVGVRENRYFVLKTFDELLDEFVKNNFITVAA
jgi:hypothetical protein